MGLPGVQSSAREQLASLRQRFKVRCAETEQRHQNWQIRVHRALSWFERAIDTDPGEQPDGRLLYGWIAFNALYGRWDVEAGFPAPDMAAWRDFLKVVLQHDSDCKMAERLQRLREPILQLLENKFVDSRFWQNPGQPGNLRRRYHEALSLFVEGRWLSLAVMAMERVYVFRGQLVHGAATRGSELNRATLRQTRDILEGLMLPILEIVIEQAGHDEWPPLCYPPVYEETSKLVPPVSPRRPR
jgi:Apea-like HEPN